LNGIEKYYIGNTADAIRKQRLWRFGHAGFA